MRVPRCAALPPLWSIGCLFFFFFSLHNSFRSLSPVPLLPTSSCPLSAPVSEQYLPQSSLCRLLDQVLQVPHLPPSETEKTRLSKPGCGQWPLPNTPLPSSRKIQHYWKPGLWENELRFFSFVYSVFLSESSSALQAFAGLQITASNIQQLLQIFPHQPRERAHTHA